MRVRQGLKALQLLFFPARWHHFSARYRAEAQSVAHRVRSLRALIGFLGSGKDIILVTRSASGRVASLIADEFGIRKLVCLGYPFRRPNEAIDPRRYAHLENLQTPCLILQGTRDTYGGREIAARCRFARNTAIHWLDTDHDFSLSDQEWDRMLALIHEFILAEENPANELVSQTDGEPDPAASV